MGKGWLLESLTSHNFMVVASHLTFSPPSPPALTPILLPCALLAAALSGAGKWQQPRCACASAVSPPTPPSILKPAPALLLCTAFWGAGWCEFWSLAAALSLAAASSSSCEVWWRGGDRMSG